MKKRKPRKDRAAASTTAPTIELHGKSYQDRVPLSNLKSEIGTLLLCLQFPIGQPLSQIGWELLERLLRRYVNGRVLSQSGPEPSQATISYRPE